eukprot:365999-Chlamydomonas_euryale.AAC.11
MGRRQVDEQITTEQTKVARSEEKHALREVARCAYQLYWMVVITTIDKHDDNPIVRSARQHHKWTQEMLCENEKPISCFLFLTVSPEEHWTVAYEYCYERGEDEANIGKGNHLHMVLQKEDKKSFRHCEREIQNTPLPCRGYPKP